MEERVTSEWNTGWSKVEKDLNEGAVPCQWGMESMVWEIIVGEEGSESLKYLVKARICCSVIMTPLWGFLTKDTEEVHHFLLQIIFQMRS